MHSVYSTHYNVRNFKDVYLGTMSLSRYPWVTLDRNFLNCQHLTRRSWRISVWSDSWRKVWKRNDKQSAKLHTLWRFHVDISWTKFQNKNVNEFDSERNLDLVYTLQLQTTTKCFSFWILFIFVLIFTKSITAVNFTNILWAVFCYFPFTEKIQTKVE